MNRRQYLAEHSFFVAIYADQIADLIEWPGDRGALMRYALWHDMHETVTGDIPGPVKRTMLQGVPDEDESFDMAMETVMRARYGNAVDHMLPSKDIAAIIKLADRIDEMMYMQEEASLGNSTMTKQPWENTSNGWMTAVMALPCKDDLKHKVIDECQKHKGMFQTEWGKVFGG